MIVSISREYGSGGRLIGQEAAEMLGFPFYDKALISLVAEETGLTEEYVKKHQETQSVGWFRDVAFNTERMRAEDYLFVAEKEVIRNLTQEHENLIIVGRSADYYLRKNKPHLRVFIYCPREERIRRLQRYYELGEEGADERLQKTDRQRARYYRSVTGQEWGDPANYDLMINSEIGVLNAARIIAQAVNSFGEEPEPLDQRSKP